MKCFVKDCDLWVSANIVSMTAHGYMVHLPSGETREFHKDEVEFPLYTH